MKDIIYIWLITLFANLANFINDEITGITISLMLILLIITLFIKNNLVGRNTIREGETNGNQIR